MSRSFLKMLGIVALAAAALASFSPSLRAGEPEVRDGCTCITVGRLASVDGSVMTSHTADSYSDRTWINVVPGKKHPPGSKAEIYDKTNTTASAFDLSARVLVGEIPQVSETLQYLNSMLPPMNEHQLGVGESTFGGKPEMKSDKGLINYWELNRLMVERARTAREAIRIVDELTKEYGYNDGGECFTIADTKEVWHLEILGPGKGKVGAVWAAQRVPDDHVSVNANASRIRHIDLSDPDRFMASENVFCVAQEMGFWDPDSGKPFEFCYAYADRGSMASRRREWRVLDLLAPSLKLDPNAENYPFSVKPEKKVSARDIMTLFRDTFEGTEFDMTQFITIRDKDGKMVKSPHANPFMPYDMMPLFNINGGWGARGERCLARFYCTYVTVIQSRGFLPDPIGGVVWFGYDNPATTAYAPLYCCATELPQSYQICGRRDFRRDCAWWSFNRVADLAAQRWGDMRHDVEKVWKELEDRGFADQPRIEAKALELYKKDPAMAVWFLTNYSNNTCKEIEKAYWDLGDLLWTKYTGKF